MGKTSHFNFKPRRSLRERAFTCIELLAGGFIVIVSIGIGQAVAYEYGVAWGWLAGIAAFAASLTAVAAFYKAMWRRMAKKYAAQNGAGSPDPNTSTIPEPPEGLRYFLRRTNVGANTLGIMWIGTIVLVALAANTPGYRLCGVTLFFASFVIMFGGFHVNARRDPALKVSRNPKLVFWAYPSNPSGEVKKTPPEKWDHIGLHLRDGSKVLVDMSPMQMEEFAGWLSEQNPDIRWGDYDHPMNEEIEERAGEADSADGMESH